MIVCENGLRAVCYLTRYGQDKATANAEHIAIFGELGLCPVIVEILRKFSGNDKIALYGCKTIMNLGALPENNACFGQYGACEVILLLLQTFSHLDLVLKQALWAVINLSSFDENNKRFYGIGCGIIVDLLKSNLSEEEISSWLLLAVQNLANSKENRRQFGELGVCEYVIHAMTIHMKHTPSIEFGCMALDKLALDSQNNQIIGQCNGCELILNVMRKHLDNDMLCELAWKACHRIARDREENILSFGRNNIATLMCQTIQKHSHVEEVMEQLLVTLTVMMSYKTVIPNPPMAPTGPGGGPGTGMTSTTIKKHRRTVTREIILDGKSMRRVLGESGLCKPLVYLLGLYTSDEAITKATHGQSNNIGMIYLCLKIISMLSTDDLINKIQFGEYGCCEKTIAAMTLHLGSEDIALKGCCAIASLVTNCPMNSSKFSAIGANAVIFRVLQKYTLTKKVIMSGFDALISLTEVTMSSASTAATGVGGGVGGSEAQGRRYASRNTDESGFDIVGKIIRLNAQSIEITMSGIRLIYLLLLSFVTRGSGGNFLMDSLHTGGGEGNGKILTISSKSIQVIGEIVHRAFVAFASNLNVLYYCLLTIAELSIDAVNSSYLGSLGICSLVVQTIESLLFNLSTTDPLQTISYHHHSPPGRLQKQQYSRGISHRHQSFEMTEVDLMSSTSLTSREEREELTMGSKATEETSNAIKEIEIFEVGLRAISSLAVDGNNSQVLSDCNVSDIILKISSIYFLNENIMKQASLCLAYFTKLPSTRNILLNNNLVALVLKILSAYHAHYGIMKSICITLVNIFQSHHMEGCKEFIERNLNTNLLLVFDHFKKDHFIVKDILLIQQNILEALYPSSSSFIPSLQQQQQQQALYSVTLHVEPLCEKLSYVLKSYSESPDLCNLACRLITLLSFHYPHCSQQFYQLGYGELSLYLLHSHHLAPPDPPSPSAAGGRDTAAAEAVDTQLILHIFQSYQLIGSACPEFLSTFSDSHFLDFIFHDILLLLLPSRPPGNGEGDNAHLVQEILSFTSSLLNYFSTSFCLETLVTSSTMDDETYYDSIFRIISLYPHHTDIISHSTAILSRTFSSLSSDNDDFIQSHPSILTILDSPSSSLVEIALTVLPLSRRNLSHQNHWILLLKSLVVYGFDREMKFLIQQIQEHSLQIIDRVMKLLSKQRSNLLSQQNHIASYGCFILGFIGSLSLENNLALSQVGFVAYSMDILTSLLAAIQPTHASPHPSPRGITAAAGGTEAEAGGVVIPDHLLSLFESLSYALCILTGNDTNRLILKDLNLCTFIGNLVLTFLPSEEIINNCCQILVNLALIDDNSKVLLGNNSCCEACHESFRYYLYQSSNIVKTACYGCVTLAIDEQNKERFSRLPICQLILQGLDYYSLMAEGGEGGDGLGNGDGDGGDHDFMELGLSALINLADHHEVNKNNICSDISTSRSGDGETTSVDQILLKILHLYSSDHRILELCLMLLVNLTEDSHLPSLQLLSNLSLFQMIFKLIQSLSSSSSSSDLCIQGLWYLRNIFNYSNLRQTDLFPFLSTNIQPLCRCILDILSKNNTEFNSLLVEQSCQCLFSLLHLSSPSTSLTLTSSSTLSSVVSTSCSNSCCEHIINLNGFSSLLAVAYIYSKDEQIINFVTQILSMLLLYCSNYSTEEIEGTLERLCTIHEIITSIFLTHFSHEMISLSSLQILFEIFQRNSYAKVQIKDWSDCSEAIVHSLQTHYQNSQIVILSTELILLLSASSREYQSIIGATGGGEAYIVTILHYLQTGGGETTVENAIPIVVLCLRACNALLTNNAANVVMIGPNFRQVILQIFSVIIENCLSTNSSSPEKNYSDLVTNSFICLKLLAGSNKQFFIDSGALHDISELLVWDFIHPLGPSSGEDNDPSPGATVSTAAVHPSLLKMSSSASLDSPPSPVEDSSLPVSIAACDALLVLLGEDCIDSSLFGGIDLPSCLLKKLLAMETNLGPIPTDQSLRMEFFHKALKLVLTILRLDSQTTNPKNKRILMDYPLLRDTQQLLLHHHKSLAMMEFFLYVANLEGLDSLMETREAKEELRQTLESFLQQITEGEGHQEEQEGNDIAFCQTVTQQLHQLLQDSFSE